MVAKKVSERSDQTTPPTQFAETTPPNYPSVDHSFTVQGIFDLKGSVSKLEQTVVHLQDAVSELKSELKTVQKLVWIATGAFLVVSVLAGTFGVKMWDMMVRINAYMQAHP